MRKDNKGLPVVDIWVDGSVYPTNPGPYGGWGAVLVSINGKGKAVLELSGLMEQTVVDDKVVDEITNNKAETEAIIGALEALTKPCHARVYTDSRYAMKCFAKIKKGYLPRANKDYWKRLKDLIETKKHFVSLIKVEGHSGNANNERAHKLAYRAATNREEVNERTYTSNGE